MRWFLFLFILPLMLLPLGCPGSKPTSPGNPTPTPTITSTPTATCVGGSYFGSKTQVPSALLVLKGKTRLFAGSFNNLTTPGTVNTLEGLFYCDDPKQDIQFALYDGSGNKLLETVQGVIPRGSGLNVQYGLPVTPTLLSPGTYWLAVIIRNKAGEIGAGIQPVDGSGWGYQAPATFGNFPDPASFTFPGGAPALAADYCP